VAKLLYLEDLKPGMVFNSAEHALDEKQLIAFAEQFDPQPFHLDQIAAMSSLFGGLAASGWHTAAITMKLLVASVPLAGGIVGAGIELAWPKPVRPNDVLHVFTQVMEITPSRSKPDRGLGVLRSETRNRAREPVQITTAKLVLQRRKV